MYTNLRILQPWEIWYQVEFKPIDCTLKGYTANKKDEHEDIWTGGSEVHNLQEWILDIANQAAVLN